MNVRIYNKLRDDFNVKVLDECLDERDRRCIKKFLEVGDHKQNGGFRWRNSS